MEPSEEQQTGPSNFQRPDPETAMRIFKIVNKLLRATGFPSNEEYKVQVRPGGGIDAIQLAELLISQPHINLSDAKPGDVVWWRDEKGYTGYFLITEPYFDPGNAVDFRHGRGILRIESEHGIIENEEGTVEGAGFEMTHLGKISKNLPIRIAIPQPSRHWGYYQTYPVVDMGIIQAEDIA